MMHMLIDEAIRAKLVRAKGPVELVAEDGTLIGQFTPTNETVVYNIDPGISEEEIARRFADKTSPRYTTAEVIAHLRKL